MPQSDMFDSVSSTFERPHKRSTQASERSRQPKSSRIESHLQAANEGRCIPQTSCLSCAQNPAVTALTVAHMSASGFRQRPLNILGKPGAYTARAPGPVQRRTSNVTWRALSISLGTNVCRNRLSSCTKMQDRSSHM